MNKTRILLLALAVVISPSLAQSDDWQIAMYDAARQVFAKRDQNERNMMVILEPRTSELYTIRQPMDDAYAKMQRYSFIRRLHEEPKSIDWKNVWIWSQGTESTDQEIRLAEKDPVFKSLRDDFLLKRKLLKEMGRHDLFEMRNRIYESHCDQFRVIEEGVIEQLNELQLKVNVILKGG